MSTVSKNPIHLPPRPSPVPAGRIDSSQHLPAGAPRPAPGAIGSPLAALNTVGRVSDPAPKGIFHQPQPALPAQRPARQTMSQDPHKKDDELKPWLSAFGRYALPVAGAIVKLNKSFDAKDRPRDFINQITFNGKSAGLLSGYPKNREEAFTQIVKTASNNTGIRNFADAKNDVRASKTTLVRDHFPPHRPVRSPDGKWEITRLTDRPRHIDDLGVNASGKPVSCDVDRYQVKHVATGLTREVPYASINNFDDNSTPPGETLRNLAGLPKRLGFKNPHQVSDNCAAGIGRSAALKEIEIVCNEIDERVARGETVTYRDVIDIAFAATVQMREQRGHSVMPNPFQQMAVIMGGFDHLDEVLARQAAGARAAPAARRQPHHLAAAARVAPAAG